MKKIRFLHIPKTAGSSFTDCLRRLYREGGCFYFCGRYSEDSLRFLALSEDSRAQISLVTGHGALDSGLSEVDALPTITFLRDPIERVKSFCQHVSEGKSRYLLKEYPPDSFDLSEFLFKSKNYELENLMTAMLVGYPYYEANRENPEALLKLAKKRLFEDLEAFGLVEFFDPSLILFKRHFGWGMPVYVRQNRRSKSKLLTFKTEHLERIRELNQIDLALYEASLSVFRERIESVHGLEQDIKRLHLANAFALPWFILRALGKRVRKRVLGRDDRAYVYESNGASSSD